jgi:hypothetical protein
MSDPTCLAAALFRCRTCGVPLTPRLRLLADLVNVGYHPDYGRRHGCCGLDGMDGMNRVCSEGHEVATESSDQPRRWQRTAAPRRPPRGTRLVWVHGGVERWDEERQWQSDLLGRASLA